MKYLIRPFDQLIIRQNPIYDDGVFILEKLNKDLSLYKEYHNGEAEDVESFFEKLKTSESLYRKNKTVFKRANQPGWVLIETKNIIQMDDLWKRAMEKVREQKFYQKETSDIVSKVEDVQGVSLKMKLYINDNSGVLAVMKINGYPKVLRGIDSREELGDTWSAIKINGRQYDVNIYDEAKACIYGLKKSSANAEEFTVNTSDSLALPVEVITNKKQEEHANGNREIPRV